MRKTYIKVKDLGMARLNKAEFLGFLSRVITILKELKEGSSSGSEPDLPEVQSETDGVASLYIDQALIDELQACLDELQDRTRNSRSTLATKTLEQIDKERDALVSYILTVLAQSLDLSLADQREAGTILYNDLNVYAGATGLPQTQETVTINGMIGDAESEKLAPHVETMGLLNRRSTSRQNSWSGIRTPSVPSSGMRLGARPPAPGRMAVRGWAVKSRPPSFAVML